MLALYATYRRSIHSSSYYPLTGPQSLFLRTEVVQKHFWVLTIQKQRKTKESMNKNRCEQILGKLETSLFIGENANRYTHFGK